MYKDIISIVKNSKVEHPIAKAAKSGNRYWTDFLAVIEDYRKKLSKKELEGFLKKSKLDTIIDTAQYLQFASEATVVDYIIRKYDNFKNEPKYNDKKNPECSFEYKGRTVNIEVKCPDLRKRIEQESFGGIKVFAAERFPEKEDYNEVKKDINEHLLKGQNIQVVDRLDNKLGDYLTSAHKKFPNSSESTFNILVIALDIIPDLDEWYSYFFGDNGVFTDKSYIKADYENVDAVLLTNIQHGHMSDDVDLNNNLWHLENYVSLLLLDPRKERKFGLGEYYFESAIHMFGDRTCGFLQFQNALDQKNNIRNSALDKSKADENQKEEMRRKNYADDKWINLQIVSEWLKIIKRPYL